MSASSWHAPERKLQSGEPRLRVYNSLTKSKDEFVTRKPGRVSWYACGPTVYDSAHLGHARAYLSQDIMRRILRDYFNFDVRFVMNVTDIDDKIILRARQTHLLEQFILQHPTLTSAVVENVRSAWLAYFAKNLSGTLEGSEPASFEDARRVFAEQIIAKAQQDKAWADKQAAKDEKFTMHMSTLSEGLRALDAAAAETSGAEAVAQLVNGNRDPLGASLDKLLGGSITDPKIFRDFAAAWEQSFFSSMRALRVERPDKLTRVSEYIGEIVAFVERLVERGYAYESEGNVWFDVRHFDGADVGEVDEAVKHVYAKLSPSSKGNSALLADGEGSLSSGAGKRSAADFALWKTSKPGEPAWPSPWGEGRPGWHIECSAMASAVLGDNMDVHSGGVDLQFPHHDNELAQSEAYHGCRQWVNYFWHSGHLHIEGLKMSKSLKNFITIDDALKRNSARQIRMAFLASRWDANLDYKESLMSAVKANETTFNNFFTNFKAMESEASDANEQQDLGEAEEGLLDALAAAKQTFHDALADSFDTPRAMQTLLNIVGETNVYIAGRGGAGARVHLGAVRRVAEWTTQMLKVFGLGEGSAAKNSIGWGEASADGADSADRDEVVMPFARVIANLRDRVRELAFAAEGETRQQLLMLSDKVRDEDCVELGVALDDRDSGGALVKLMNPEALREDREARRALAEKKKAEAAQKAAAKAAKAAEDERKRREKEERARIAPTEYFKATAPGEYSEFDDAGLPTKDKEGNELPKSRRKKLEKELKSHENAHKALLESQK